MPAPEPILALAPARQAQAAAVICQAFRDDPLGLYIAPDPARRALLVSWFAATGLALGFKCGEIFTTPPVTGVAVWFPPGQIDPSLWDLLQQGIYPPLNVGPIGLGRFLRVMQCLSRTHRRHAPEPHWYLFSLTVATPHQGQGIGGKLIQPILNRADAAALPCYLVTANPQALPFYRQHGFSVVHQAHLPGSSTPFWGLRREPQ